MSDTHIVRQYEEELREIKDKVVRLGGLVEKQISEAVRALTERDTGLAEAVIEKDKVVNHLEVEIDELCIRILALRQPAASDLRLITTALRIITDLERVGDMAENISERVVELNREAPLKPYIDLPLMAVSAQKMLKDSIDAFVNGDVGLAGKVLKDDDIVDDLNQKIFGELLGLMQKDHNTVSRAMKVMFISKYMERIGDHATNIAELVIFMVRGKVIRHMKPEEEDCKS